MTLTAVDASKKEMSSDYSALLRMTLCRSHQVPSLWCPAGGTGHERRFESRRGGGSSPSTLTESQTAAATGSRNTDADVTTTPQWSGAESTLTVDAMTASQIRARAKVDRGVGHQLRGCPGTRGT